jgi:hypothetical protein
MQLHTSKGIKSSIIKIIKYHLNIVCNIWIEIDVMNSIIKEESGGKRSIDIGDLFAAIIDATKNFFARKGILLDEKTYVSLFLFIWSVVLIFLWIYDYIGVYFILAVLLLYFLFKVYIKWSGYDYDLKRLGDDKIEHTKVALIIGRLAINDPDEFIKLINDYMNEGKFKESVQIALIGKYNKYSFKLKAYTENLVLEKKVTPKAAGLFLIKSAKSLPDEFLRNIVDKYRDSNSFLFNLGRSQWYEFKDGTIEQKYFNAGYQFKKIRRTNQIVGILLYISIMFLYILLSSMLIFKSNIPIVVLPIFLIFYLFVLLLVAIVLAAYLNIAIFMIEKKKAKMLLKKEQIELSEIKFDKFINELNIG